jgi:hypothetical protein
LPAAAFEGLFLGAGRGEGFGALALLAAAFTFPAGFGGTLRFATTGFLEDLGAGFGRLFFAVRVVFPDF